MKTIHVAAGIIQRGGASGEILAVQRGYGDMAGLWEFPGGKIEHGETAADACVRELREELQVTVTNLRDFYTVEYDYPAFHLSMQCFFCQLATGEGEPVAHDQQRELRWVPRRALAELSWMPADIDLVRALIDAWEHDEVTLRVEDGATGEETVLAGASEDEAAEATLADVPPGEPGTEKKTRSQRNKKRKPRTKKKSKPDLLDGIDTSDLSATETALVRRRAAIRKSMQGNKRADTKPEMLVRQRLRAAGLTGYRLQWKQAPGRPDIAFPGRKIAIFVNGCFWHRCPHCQPSMPKRNVEFWEAKFRRNVERDQRAIAELHDQGWEAITIWECELTRTRIEDTMATVIDRVRHADARTTRTRKEHPCR